MIYTRRDLGKIAVAALPMARLMAKPSSVFGGVEIGIIVSPTGFREIPLPADEMLKSLVQLGISAVEMQEVRVEIVAGAPAGALERFQGAGRVSSAPEQQEARRRVAEEVKKWRMSVSMDKYKAIRGMYESAGVHIFALRLAERPANMSDEEYEYFFNLAEALGANQITVELPPDPAVTQRFGAYAARRKMMIGYHNHTQVNFNSWDAALSQSRYNGINFDVGHFAAAVSQSPIPFIEKYHDRIASLHLKDRKLRTNGGQNMPWGQGDTQLKEVLQLVKKEKYGFPAAIELEYRVPEGSTKMAEAAKCIEFCKNALT